MNRFIAASSIALMTLLPLGVHGQPDTNKLPQPQPTTVCASCQPGSDPALLAEVRVLREFTQHILTTVYFSLATVAVVLLTMVGFGWYQNFRAYERDKEALRQSLSTSLQQDVARRFTEIESMFADRLNAVDQSVASAMEQTLNRLADSNLSHQAAVFQAAHAPKTPRTDFMLYTQQIVHSIGHVEPGVLDHALSVALEHVESSAKIDAATHTALLELAELVKDRNPVFGERLRKVLTNKSQ